MGLNRPTLLIFALFYVSLLLLLGYTALWLQDPNMHLHLWVCAAQGIDPSQIFTQTRGLTPQDSFHHWEETIPFFHRVLYTFAFWAGCWWRIGQALVGLVLRWERVYVARLLKELASLVLPFLSMRI